MKNLRNPAPRPRARGVLALSLGLLALSGAAPLAAQDVLHAGRAHGVPAPRQALEILRRDPQAFEFRRAWRQKAARVREARRRLERREGPRLSASRPRAADAALSGALRVPVLLGAYGDANPAYTPAQCQERLFGTPATGYSAKSFYLEMSRGVFALDGTVTEWLLLPGTARHYEPDPTDEDDQYGRTGEFLRDALLAADFAMDFGQFDNDGPDGIPNSGDDDGYVDAAAFVYPAAGMSCGGPGIWPHRYVYRGWHGAPFTTNDPSASGGSILVDDYLIQGGIACNGSSLMTIGTFAHEMGHAIGLPDLYDTDPADGDTEGLGEWDLMASGNYNSQSSPAHMGAWSKDFLGWVGVETVSASRTGQVLSPVYDAGQVLRYDVPGTREYFLLEHRSRTGSDAFLRGPGLLVYHVDADVVEAGLFNNRVNARPVRGVDLEEADGRDDLDFGRNRGDAGDPFPGSTGRTAFTAEGVHNTGTNAGGASGLALRNIGYAGATLRFDVEVSTGAPVLVGDLSGDGQITSQDALGVLTAVVGKNLPAGWRAGVAADANCDGATTAVDALIILSRTVGADVGAYCVGSER